MRVAPASEEETEPKGGGEKGLRTGPNKSTKRLRSKKWVGTLAIRWRRRPRVRWSSSLDGSYPGLADAQLPSAVRSKVSPASPLHIS
jgi:hypothetical protein